MASISGATQYFSKFAGRLFDRLAAETPPDHYTAADLYAAAALSAPIDPVEGIWILEDPEVQTLLGDVPTDVSIADPGAAEVLADESTASRLYLRLREVRGIGPTRASKLLAVKRPALVPIRDSYVEAVLGAATERKWWAPMLEAWE